MNDQISFGTARGVLSTTAGPARTGGDDGAIITAVETYALSVPLTRPIADATAAMAHWTVPVVEIRTADGRTGTGISGVHCAPELLLDVIHRYYADSLLGTSAEDIAGTWKRLYWLPTHWIGRAGAVHMALGMVDTALWDLAAQRADVPLWTLLGGTPDPVEAYNTDAGWLNLTEDELVRDLAGLVEQGWRRVKIKVGREDWREDARRVRAVRRALGDEVTLMCDANQRWDRSTAARILPVLEEAAMDWVEEPFHADDLHAHARLQQSTRLDVAAGESIYTYHQFAAFLEADAIRVVQADVTRVGGVTEFQQIAAQAAARGLRLAPHAGDMMQVHQHLVGTIVSEAPPLIEYIPWTREAFAERSVVRGGLMERPQLPGASTAIDPEARARWQTPGTGSIRTR